MAIPTTKATFKSYCLRALGHGVIDINVSDEPDPAFIDIEDKKDEPEEVEEPDESDTIDEEKSIHQEMYEIATAKYNPFAVGGSENIHDFDSLGGSEKLL